MSTFQALQHRMVDMFIHCEETRSMALKAALEVDNADPGRACPRAVRRQGADRQGRARPPGKRRSSSMAAWG
ncbi:MAG: hypothetical protein WDO24_10735 [Pseudomonadota bacterium]